MLIGSSNPTVSSGVFFDVFCGLSFGLKWMFDSAAFPQPRKSVNHPASTLLRLWRGTLFTHGCGSLT